MFPASPSKEQPIIIWEVSSVHDRRREVVPPSQVIYIPIPTKDERTDGKDDPRYKHPPPLRQAKNEKEEKATV